MVDQLLLNPLEPEVQQILCMTLTVAGLRGASHGCEPIPLFARENMTLDEDVHLEINAHRCILDPLCVCVCA
jgi:hypothetical protein